jgi:hypothetical protein
MPLGRVDTINSGWGGGVATTPDDVTLARGEFDAGTGSPLALTATNPSRPHPVLSRFSGEAPSVEARGRSEETGEDGQAASIG